MGKYSSDSDSEKRRNKYSHKSKSSRRSNSSESNSRNYYKDDGKLSRRRRHSQSRSRYSNSYSHKSNKRSGSIENSRNRRSSSRDRHHRSQSKDQHRSRRSRSRSYIKEYVSTKRSSSSSSNSSVITVDSDSSRSKNKANGSNVDSSCLSKFAYTYVMDAKALEEINKDTFSQKSFSSKRKVPENIVIDLKKQTIKVPQVEPIEPDSIFHHSLFLSEESRIEKWVKELYSYRQKALQQGNKKKFTVNTPLKDE